VVRGNAKSRGQECPRHTIKIKVKSRGRGRPRHAGESRFPSTALRTGSRG